MVNKTSSKSTMVVLAEALSKGQENPFLKYVHITDETNCCHIHEEKSCM